MEKFRPYALPNAKWLAEVKEKLTAKCQASGVKPSDFPPDLAQAAADSAVAAEVPADDDDDKDAA